MNYKLIEPSSLYFKKYANCVVLKYFLDNRLSILLGGDFKHLSRQIDWLHGNGYLNMTADNYYEINSAGKKYLNDYNIERLKWIAEYDVYSSVDLQAGEFAFAEYKKFIDKAEFQDYIAQDRFSDIRLEVIQYLSDGLPESVVAERIFDVVFAVGFDKIDWFSASDWQFQLLVSNFEIVQEIVTNTPNWFDYGPDIESAKDIFNDILKQGQALKEELRF